jgi:hypothetical protein
MPRFLLDARPGDGYADAVEEGDDRKRQQKDENALAPLQSEFL